MVRRLAHPLNFELALDFTGARVPLDKSEGVVKAQLFGAVLRAPLWLPEMVEDQDSGNLTVNHFSVKPIVSPTIDTA